MCQYQLAQISIFAKIANLQQKKYSDVSFYLLAGYFRLEMSVLYLCRDLLIFMILEFRLSFFVLNLVIEKRQRTILN